MSEVPAAPLSVRDILELDEMRAGDPVVVVGAEGLERSVRWAHVVAGPDAAALIDGGELIVKGMHITPYDHGNIFNADPTRERRLLAHKSEIRRLGQQCKLQGYTLVPLSLYFKHGRVKMELGLCKGKKLYDKRADAAKRDAKRSIDRALKSNGHYY